MAFISVLVSARGDGGHRHDHSSESMNGSADSIFSLRGTLLSHPYHGNFSLALAVEVKMSTGGSAVFVRCVLGFSSNRAQLTGFNSPTKNIQTIAPSRQTPEVIAIAT